MIFQEDSLTITFAKNGKTTTVDKGTFKIDSRNGRSNAITMFLDKKYPDYPYNALYIGLELIDTNKIQILVVESVYHKGTLHTIHHKGDYLLFKD